MQGRVSSDEWEAHWERLVFLPLQFIKIGKREVTSYLQHKSNLHEENILILEIKCFPSLTKWTELVDIGSVHTLPVANPWTWVHPSDYNDEMIKTGAWNTNTSNLHAQKKRKGRCEMFLYNLNEWHFNDDFSNNL